MSLPSSASGILTLFVSLSQCVAEPPAGQTVVRPHDAGAPIIFPYGAMHMATISHWQHYLPPLDEWATYIENDIARMKQVHFNTVAAHVDWYDIEPAPGRFQFERLDKLIEAAEKHGLKVLLWPWPELQPEWVPLVHPDSEMIASDGYRPGIACWDHPHVRTAVERFIDRVVTRYKDRPSVLAWDVGAEAGLWVSSINNPIDQARTSRLYCYCDHTARRYREWLQRKYGTIDKLNEVWATHYRDWSAVRPVRAGIFERAQIFWLDWREFMLWNITDFQKLKADTAKRVDPNRPITAHIGGWGGGYVFASTDEYNIAKSFDMLSLSLFPYWLAYGHGWYEPSLAGMQLDGVRSAGNGKPMWVEELQGGPSVNGLAYRSMFPRPEDIRLWVWQSIAHGATGIFYWNWRPETTGIEASGFGLVNYDGSLTDRAESAGELAATLQRHAALLQRAKPAPAQVAIFHSPRTAIQTHGEGDESCYGASVRGLYRALWRANLPVDILVSEQLLNADLTRYRIIYLPFCYTLSRAEGARLKAYVENGGTLYAELWCGLKDDRTFLYETVPGAGMAEVLGCKQVQVNPAGAGGMMKITRVHAALGALAVGAAIPVHKYQDRITVLPGAEPIAQFDNGDPAIIVRSFGKGKTLYAGSMVSRGYDQSLNANAQELLLGVAAWAGASPPVAVEKEPKDAAVEARLLEAPDGRSVLIVMNHGTTKATVSLSLSNDVAARLSDLISGEVLRAAPDGAKAKLAIELAPADVRVVLVERRASEKVQE